MKRERRESPWTRSVFGATVLAAGVIFWLDRTGSIDARDYLEYWPLALIAMGLAHLPQRRWGAAIVWTAIGLAFLLPLHHPWRIIGLWPLLISVGGVTLITQAFRVRPPGSAVHAVAVMGANVQTIASQQFAGAELVAVCAGTEIDLSSAQMQGREVIIDVLAFWGGIEIKVPSEWNVDGRVVQILGGYEDKTAPPAGENAPRLIIRGSAIMGGVEVRNP